LSVYCPLCCEIFDVDSSVDRTLGNVTISSSVGELVE
jgi:hypothetical protein